MDDGQARAMFDVGPECDLTSPSRTLQSCDLQYFVHGPVVFGAPFFARELVKVVARYGIKAHFQQNLVAVDGPAKTATFEAVGGDDKGKRTTITFGMLHVSPPQSPHDVSEGEISPSEGAAVAVLISTCLQAIDRADVVKRLDALERLIKGRPQS